MDDKKKPKIGRREMRNLLNWERKRLENTIDYLITNSPRFKDDQETIECFEYNLQNQIEQLRQIGLCFLKYEEKISLADPSVDFDATVEEIRKYKKRLELDN